MHRVPLIDRAHTTPERQALLDEIHGAFGATPAMFRAVANSPAALRSMWEAFKALGGGTLGARLGEQIAVAVANRNACAYCLAAHTVLGQKAGASAADMAAAQVGSADVQALRDVGFSDEAVVEILAHVALNLFTNYINVALEVPVDFPAVALRHAG